MPLADWKADLDEMERDIGSTITFAGKNYTALVSNPIRGREHELAGYMPDDQLEAVITVDDYKTLPVLGNTIVFDGRTYRIVQIQDSNEGEAKVLTLEERTT